MNRRKFLYTVSSLSLIWVTGCTPSKINKTNNLDNSSAGVHEHENGYWTCTMHPQVHKNEPGKCPICGMPLVHVDSKTHVEKAESAGVEPSQEQLKNASISKYTVTKKDFIVNLPVTGRMTSSREVTFQIYESDFATLKMGLEFGGVASTNPQEILKGRISFIDKLVDPSSRTVRVVGVLQSSASSFVAETSFQGQIQNKIKNQITIPEDAVLHAGTRDLVYVFNKENRFEPRPVSLGQKNNKEYQILSGLQEGEVISAGANFLIDSEAKIRGQ